MFNPRSMILLLLLVSAACSGGSNPTEPGPLPLPLGIAKATAFQNLPLIRQLQNRKKAGTLLVGIGGTCIESSGRLCPQEAWQYVFSDRSGPSDIRYSWSVLENGTIVEFDPMPATELISGIDLEPFLSIESDQAITIALDARGYDYLQKFPDGFAKIAYFHFASQVRALVTFDTFSAFCQVKVDLSAVSGTVLGIEDCCLTGAC